MQVQESERFFEIGYAKSLEAKVPLPYNITSVKLLSKIMDSLVFVLWWSLKYLRMFS